MTDSFTAEEQALMDNPVERSRTIQRMVNLGIQREKEQEQQMKSIKQQLDRYKALVSEQRTKIIGLEAQNTGHTLDLQRVSALTSQLRQKLTAMGAQPLTPESAGLVQQSDVVGQLEVEINRFIQQFCTMVEGMCTKMAQSMKKLLQGEVESHTTTAAPSESGSSVVGSPIPSACSSDSETESVKILEQNVKTEVVAPLKHRVNASKRFRGRHVCHCSLEFDSGKALRKHIRYHYNGPRKPIWCPYVGDWTKAPEECLQDFQSAGLLTEHVQSFHRKRIRFCQCSYCHEVIKLGKGRLKLHHLESHNIVLIDDEDDDTKPENVEQDGDINMEEECVGTGFVDIDETG